jgi:hypothetical protein
MMLNNPQVTELFAIDNYANCLSPMLAKTFTEYILNQLSEGKTNKQIVIATNNYEVLKQLPKESEDVAVNLISKIPGNGSLINKISIRSLTL